MLLLYIFLGMVVAASVITGIIVTIMDKQGLFPEDEARRKKKHSKKSNDVTTSTEIILSSGEDEEEYYSIPVIVSSYTVDLSNVVVDIQRMNPVDSSLGTTSIQEENVI